MALSNPNSYKIVVPATFKVFKRNIININTISTNSAGILSYKIIGRDINHSGEDHADKNPVTYHEPPVLFLHGLVGNKKQWEGIAKTMAHIVKREAVVIDLRNHGDSPHFNSHKYEDLTGDILLLIEKLGIKQASLLGHSMGGKAAMCLSLTAPQKVAGLLLVDVSPVSTPLHYKNKFPKVLELMKSIDFSKANNLAIAQKEAKVKLKQAVPITDCVLKAILSNIIVKPNNTIGWSCNLDVLIKHFNDICSFPPTMKGKTYYGATTFLGGQQSDFIPPDDLPDIRRLFPKAVIKYISNAGHNVHEDDPNNFIEQAIFFIRKHHYKIFSDFPIPPKFPQI